MNSFLDNSQFTWQYNILKVLEKRKGTEGDSFSARVRTQVGQTPCLQILCKKKWTQMNMHLQQKHFREAEVARAMSLPKKSQKKGVML